MEPGQSLRCWSPGVSRTRKHKDHPDKQGSVEIQNQGEMGDRSGGHTGQVHVWGLHPTRSPKVQAGTCNNGDGGQTTLAFSPALHCHSTIRLSHKAQARALNEVPCRRQGWHQITATGHNVDGLQVPQGGTSGGHKIQIRTQDGLIGDGSLLSDRGDRQPSPRQAAACRQHTGQMHVWRLHTAAKVQAGT